MERPDTAGIQWLQWSHNFSTEFDKMVTQGFNRLIDAIVLDTE